jgi:flagellar assembly protein FliH
MSTVIKANEGGRLLRRLSTVDLADHLAEAQGVIDQAKQCASQIVFDAETEVDQATAEARQSGYEAGYEKGHREGLKAGHDAAHQESMERFNREQIQLVDTMRTTVAALDAMKEDLRIAGEHNVLEFAVLIASKLTFAVGRVHREAAIENLKRALRVIDTKTDVTIHAHSDDLDAMKIFAAASLEQIKSTRVIDLVVDDSLAPGGCRVTTGRTQVDATLETQVDEIVSLLLSGASKPNPNPTDGGCHA